MLSDRTCRTAVAAFLFACGNVLSSEASAAESTALVEFGDRFDVTSVKCQDAEVRLERDEQATVLTVTAGHAARWPGVTFPAPEGGWNLSACTIVEVGLKNTGPEAVKVFCRVDSPGGDGDRNCVTENVALHPNESKILRVPLKRQVPSQLADKLFGMRGYPGGMGEKGLDPATITQILVFVHEPKQDHVFQVTGILATGSCEWGDWSALTPDKFFPMIDEYGQFVHKQWPGKTHNDGELAAAAETEAVDLAAHPGPEDWNQYGGWTAGPQLKATGYFYPEKHAGKWWLVDPEGRLFWSHGVDCVGYTGGTTPITDREFYFAGLPTEDSPLAVFYGKGSWAPHGYYEGKQSYRTFNFAGANLSRKYGENWREEEASTCHARLRSWSMNTIANWSDSRIYLQRKTPYVVSIHVGNVPRIEGSSGYWGKFPDPFDPLFREGLERRMNGERDQTAGDKWCIGYFVDNELAWGDELSLAKAALASPPGQPAKQALLGDLQQKYVEVQRLNAAWGTAYESWNAMEQSQTVPGDAKANDDLGAFTTRVAEEYFRICRDVVKHVAPQNLYLGCRFAWVNDRAAKVAARYCDVIGYNLYRDSVADFQLPAGIDKPVIIGEFHFGALDRGMFHTGLRPTASQDARASAYRTYVTGALKHPSFVGTHWFQYGDQATTGRGDGENYQIGLVDICDRPYPETIRAVREVGASLYKTRLE